MINREGLTPERPNTLPQKECSMRAIIIRAGDIRLPSHNRHHRTAACDCSCSSFLSRSLHPPARTRGFTVITPHAFFALSRTPFARQIQPRGCNRAFDFSVSCFCYFACEWLPYGGLRTKTLQILPITRCLDSKKNRYSFKIYSSAYYRHVLICI